MTGRAMPRRADCIASRTKAEAAKPVLGRPVIRLHARCQISDTREMSREAKPPWLTDTPLNSDCPTCDANHSAKDRT